MPLNSLHTSAEEAILAQIKLIDFSLFPWGSINIEIRDGKLGWIEVRKTIK